MAKVFLVLGSLNATLAVLFGAFGAHALRNQLSAEQLAVYQTAVHYQFYHALGLILIGVLVRQLASASGLLLVAGWLLLAGSVLFSGSLYALTLSGVRWLGAITPLGGVAFVLGWLLLALASWRLA